MLFARLGLAAALTLGLAAAASAKEKVVITEPNWTGASAIANILAAVMEQYLDVEAEIVTIDTAAAFAALDKGDGGADVYPDLWSQNRQAEWAKYIADGSRETIKVNAEPYKGTEGIFVPGFVQDEHKIYKVQDLANAEVAKLFDTDGDGKGEYWPGGPGWSTTDIELVKLKSYGLDSYYTSFIVEQWVFEAKLDAAIKLKKPVVFYFWAPEWIHAAYDLRRLEEPAFDGYAMDSSKGSPDYNPQGCYKIIQPQDDPQWLEHSSVTCQKPDVDVYVAHSSALTQRLPKVAKFLVQVSLEPQMVNEWIYSLSKEGVEPADMAKAWIGAHKDIVEKEWLAGVTG